MLLSESSNVAVRFLENFQHLAFQSHTIYPSVSGITINKNNCITSSIDWTENQNRSILTCASGSVARFFNLGRSSRDFSQSCRMDIWHVLQMYWIVDLLVLQNAWCYLWYFDFYNGRLCYVLTRLWSRVRVPLGSLLYLSYDVEL